MNFSIILVQNPAANANFEIRPRCIENRANQMILNNFKFCSQSAAVCQISGITLLNQLQLFIFETHFENLFLFFLTFVWPFVLFLNFGSFYNLSQPDFISFLWQLSYLTYKLNVFFSTIKETHKYLVKRAALHISHICVVKNFSKNIKV